MKEYTQGITVPWSVKQARTGRQIQGPSLLFPSKLFSSLDYANLPYATLCRQNAPLATRSDP